MNKLFIIGLLFIAFKLNAQELTHFTTKIIKSENDAEENKSNGNMDLTSSDLELCYDPGVLGIGSKNQLVGVRFESITIPKDAIIENAYIQFTADGTSSDPTIIQIFGEKMFNSPAFTDLNTNISSRSKTNSNLFWNIEPWNTSNENGINQRTPNLNEIITEIITQAIWQPNNSITFIMDGSGMRRAYSFDGASDKVAELHIYYRENDASVESLTAKQSIVYPNPFERFLTLDLSSFGNTVFEVRCYSIDGKEVFYQELIGNEKHEIDFSAFNSDSKQLILSVSSENEFLFRKLLILK